MSIAVGDRGSVLSATPAPSLTSNTCKTVEAPARRPPAMGRVLRVCCARSLTWQTAPIPLLFI